MTVTEHNSDFKLTIDTPYLTLTGQLLSVYYENFEGYWWYCNAHWHCTVVQFDIVVHGALAVLSFNP